MYSTGTKTYAFNAKLGKYFLLLLFGLVLAACKSSGSKPEVIDKEEPPGPSVPAPVVIPGELEAVLFYNRDDGNYEGYRLHTWNDQKCDAYADSALANSWDDGLVSDGVDPVYGTYWVLELKEGYGDCGNFIIHIGTDDAGKEMGGRDWAMPLKQDDPDYTRMNFTFASVAAIYEYPVTSPETLPLAIEGAGAHWIDTNTLVWDLNAIQIAAVKLHHAADAGIAVKDGSVTGSTITFTSDELTASQKARVPALSQWPAFRTTLIDEQAKAIAKQQIVAVAYNAEDEAVIATRVQQANLLDYLYTRGPDDADEAPMGIVYRDGAIDVSVWAPTAQSVTLEVFDNNKNEAGDFAMSEDAATGIWHYEGSSALDRQFYRFELQVFHPVTGKVEMLQSTDPYSVNLSSNGRYSQFVNLEDDDLKPENWDSHEIPAIENIEDAVILEAHIRDFSIRSQSVSQANRGKYLAFTETASEPVQYLKRMADAGVTHFHMLPANDIATIEEDESARIDLTSTVSELCAVNSQAPVCGVKSNSSTLLEALETYEPSTEAAQALVESMRMRDGFNWGYDPHHFNAPEGSYASDAEGVARIREMRAMNQALHGLGLRAVLDVVYNHTSASGLWDKSVLDKTVPDYYHRYDEYTGEIHKSTCCDNTATENRMMHKFTIDSLVLWAQAYKFDGFRFDLMGHMPKATILEAREAVAAIDPDTFFYGEGWTWGEVDNNRLFVQAKQFEMAGTDVATFNDRARDTIRSAALFNSSGSLYDQDKIRLGLAGTLADYVMDTSSGAQVKGSHFSPAAYAQEPTDIINYVSKHDDEALWDKLQYGLGHSMSLEDRMRAHSIAATIPLLSQGIPFFQLGVDMMRSKSMDRNSYDSGDWFNFVDFTMNTNNWNVGLPLAQDNQHRWSEIDALNRYVTRPGFADISLSSNVFKEFVQIRTSSPLFRLRSGQSIIERVNFHNTGTAQQQGLIVMSIDDGTDVTDMDPALDAIVVVINGTAETRSHTVGTAAGFSLHPVQQESADSRVRNASFSSGDNEGTFTVPALTTAVFVKAQAESQGYGLPRQ